MKKQPTPWELGATLYMPATRKDIAEVVLEGKIPGLRSLVVCLEDPSCDSESFTVFEAIETRKSRQR